MVMAMMTMMLGVILILFWLAENKHKMVALHLSRLCKQADPVVTHTYPGFY